MTPSKPAPTISPELMDMIKDREFPDNLEIQANWITLAYPEAEALGIPAEVWQEALDCAGILNVLAEPGYDHHIPGLGPWAQDVGIDFHPGISPTGDIIFEAVMYKAEITRKATLSHRDQELCRAFVIWRPESAMTIEFARAFIRTNV